MVDSYLFAEIRVNHRKSLRLLHFMIWELWPTYTHPTNRKKSLPLISEEQTPHLCCSTLRSPFPFLFFYFCSIQQPHLLHCPSWDPTHRWEWHQNPPVPFWNKRWNIYRVNQKKGRSQNIIVFHELLSLGCINFKSLCAHHQEEVLRFPKHPQLTKFAWF